MQLITNARIYTLDKEQPQAAALLISQGTILAAGSKEDL